MLPKLASQLCSVLRTNVEMLIWNKHNQHHVQRKILPHHGAYAKMKTGRFLAVSSRLSLVKFAIATTSIMLNIVA